MFVMVYDQEVDGFHQEIDPHWHKKPMMVKKEHAQAILEQMAMNDMQNTAFAIGSGCIHYIFAPSMNEPALRREWSTRAQQNR